MCLAAGFDGVHVGQDDLSPEAVRAIIGPDRWLALGVLDGVDELYVAKGKKVEHVDLRKAGPALPCD